MSEDGVSGNKDLAPRARAWTRIDAYLVGLAEQRRFAARRRQSALGRTQPEAPRLLLSTVPFAALLAMLAMLGAAIAIVAWPGSQVTAEPRPQTLEVGTAPKGWFQEAQKEFGRPQQPARSN